MDRIDLLKTKLDPIVSEELTNDNSPQDPSEIQSNQVIIIIPDKNIFFYLNLFRFVVI